jgi:hypothetical protein
MKKPSIYPDRSQELLALFEKAGNPSKLMCVPIDYAKKDHLVMFCNGNGEVLRKPFSVKNSVDGVKYLVDQVTVLAVIGIFSLAMSFSVAKMSTRMLRTSPTRFGPTGGWWPT